MLDSITKAIHHYAPQLIREQRRERAVFVPGCPFLVLFWTSKKEQQSAMSIKAARNNYFRAKQNAYEHCSIALQKQFTPCTKADQGTTPGTGCISSRLSFFGSFLDKQKRTAGCN